MNNEIILNNRGKRFSCSSELQNNGDFKEIVNVDLVINTLFNLLTIREGTYFKDNVLGCKFHRYLQEQLTEGIIDGIKFEIRNKAEMYLGQYLTILNIEVYKFNNNTGLAFDIKVEVNKEIRTVQIGITNNDVYYKSLLEY